MAPCRFDPTPIDFPFPADYALSKFPMVSIRVGEGDARKEFTVHQQILCSASAFFQASVGTNNFQEGLTQQVDSPDDDPETFGLILNWMYLRKFHPLGSLPPYRETVECYMLADKLMMPACKNELMDTLQERAHELMDTLREEYWVDLAHDMIRHTAPPALTFGDSMVRRFIIDELGFDLAFYGAPWAQGRTRDGAAFVAQYVADRIEFFDEIAAKRDIYRASWNNADEWAAAQAPSTISMRCRYHDHDDIVGR